jgi:hypothetical protein
LFQLVAAFTLNIRHARPLASQQKETKQRESRCRCSNPAASTENVSRGPDLNRRTKSMGHHGADSSTIPSVNRE